MKEGREEGEEDMIELILKPLEYYLLNLKKTSL